MEIKINKNHFEFLFLLRKWSFRLHLVRFDNDMRGYLVIFFLNFGIENSLMTFQEIKELFFWIDVLKYVPTPGLYKSFGFCKRLK